MKNTIIALAALGAVNASFADTYFFVGAKGSSWQDTNNYRLGSRTGSIPASLPGADDYVLTGAANSLSTNDVEIAAEDMSFIAGLKGIGVRYAGTVQCCAAKAGFKRVSAGDGFQCFLVHFFHSDFLLIHFLNNTHIFLPLSFIFCQFRWRRRKCPARYQPPFFWQGEG